MNTIYLALGSNIGNRYEYMQNAVALLSTHMCNIRHSTVYETKPWGGIEQNSFLNMAIQAETDLSPKELLVLTQQTQTQLGRIKKELNGPREIDIDILLYGDEAVQTTELTIPHPRIHERDFVYTPLSELNPNFKPIPTMTEPYILKRYIPTQIVGILNLSPESFGNESYTDIPAILTRVEQMIHEGAHIIDIGAQSTRPGAIQLTEKEELTRLRGVIEAIKSKFPTVTLSLDTTRLAVARMGISAGIHMLNDISGLRFDSEVRQLLVNTAVKVVLMHSQGNFTDMHKSYQYDDIITTLLEYFQRRVQELLKIGIRADQIILDPGIGFSKGARENFEIIRRLEELKTLGFPVYVGLSRKKFTAALARGTSPLDRDNGTTILHTICVEKGADFIRTHNVAQAKEVLDLLSHI